ncbi:MAG: dihydropteroate synthase [Planctomycetaceae bacterium]|nr:dihydropteroate synthase [Planctomycetaceae bacterium]
MNTERILFVTGRLAEPALRACVERLAVQSGFEPVVAVLGISVAALMHVEWVRRKLTVPAEVTRVVLPGWCQGDIDQLSREFGKPFERGPKDLHDLPRHLGRAAGEPADLSQFDIEIIAEINHLPRLSDREIIAQAGHYRDSGADVIDLGCIPGESWPQIGAATKRLRDEGFRVSIDSFDRDEVEAAVTSGAELVLSCNNTNRDWAAALPAELVVIPDDPRDLDSLDATISMLKSRGARFRVDPILEPIGFGFAASLERYLAARRKWPDIPMMMGIGNLTELTEVDSAGINLLLAGFCQELRIHSVLTTEVVNWCRSCVREFDLARRLIFHSARQGVLPKHVDSRLVMLRDPRQRVLGSDELNGMAARIKDPNYRIFAERDEIHIFNRDGYWHGRDPYEIFDHLGPLEPAHAFYLGYELAKATTALTLGKTYIQDEPLHWGFLTRPETSALHRRRRPD